MEPEPVHAGPARRPVPGVGPWPPFAGAIFCGAFLLRALAGLCLNVTPGGLRGYWLYAAMARSFLEGRGLCFRPQFCVIDVYANRPPLYPLFVAGIESLFGGQAMALIVLQAAMGAVTALLVAALASRAAGRLAGIVAGLVAAAYPYFVVNDTTLVEQPLYGALLCGSLLVLLRPGASPRAAVAGGILSGLAALTREIFVPFFGLLLAWFVLRRDGRGLRRRLVFVGVAAGAFLVTCAPWLVRNAVQLGVLGFTSSGGKALWVGNNPHTFSRYPEESIDWSEGVAFEALAPEVQRHLLAAPDEAELQRRYAALAMDEIRAAPGAMLRNGFRKVFALLSPVLNPRSRDPRKAVSYSLSYGLVLLFGAAGAVLGWRRHAEIVRVTLLALLSISAVAFVFWGQTRIRAPYDTLLIVLCGVAVARLRETRRSPASRR